LDAEYVPWQTEMDALALRHTYTTRNKLPEPSFFQERATTNVFGLVGCTFH
jgi:hypothetical protein